MTRHDRLADRLLHQAETEPTEPIRAELVARAQAHATLALAEQAELGNLIAILAALPDPDAELEFPDARLILRRSIRRRLGLFPPLTQDGQHPNGGH